jgi:soluble lytic murein transglycosylase
LFLLRRREGNIIFLKRIRNCFLKYLILILFFPASVIIWARPQQETKNDFDYYRGILNKTNSGDIENTIDLFEKSLGSSNVYIRRAAADELAAIMHEGVSLSSAAMEGMRREAAGPWGAAFDAVNKPIDKNKVLAFLLSGEYRTSENARAHVLHECEKQGVFFNNAETAAVEGHYAVSKSQYNEALRFFRAFMENGKWPGHAPALFIKYPELINDLGRVFQYTASANEGLDLFLSWERNLPYYTSNDIKYRLNFFAARIARQRGRLDQCYPLFEKARLFAPGSEQADACIWYILDSSVRGSASIFTERLEKYIPHLHSMDSINDVLEKQLRELVSRKEWSSIIRVLAVINEQGAREHELLAGYAWIMARAIEEGYLSSGDRQLAAQALNTAPSALSAAAFYRMAYNAGDSQRSSALYYRWKSAEFLGEPFLVFAENHASSEIGVSPAWQFILGFIINGVPEYAFSHIRQMEKELTIPELRVAAQALAHSGMYVQTIRLANLYTNREGYIRDRRDMELLYPRPHNELVERYAHQAGIAPSLLFALIRTESAFQSAVVSRSGAVGLTQLMPATARDTADRMRRAGNFDYTANLDLTDPGINIHIGSYYFNYLMGRFNDPLLALLSYNGGMNRVRRWKAESPFPSDIFAETISIAETRDYGRKVLAAAAMYEALYYNKSGQ